MNDPYRILGITPSATDDDVRNAYRTLMKEYSENPDKIEELTNAFDSVMNMRRGGFENGFAEVRYQLRNGNYNEADSMLESMQDKRTAEWYFLKGSTCYAKGWLDDAYTNLSQASKMEPFNREYSSAFKHMQENKNGFMKGNPNENPMDGNIRSCGCNACDVCNGLICADCCCECMGGDLIGCC